jgi:two-component system, LytTR family, sensor kinase
MINNALQQKLVKTALVVSPILALYGISPIYFFKPVANTIIIGIYFSILLLSLLFWCIDVAVFKIAYKLHIAYRFLLSYAATLIAYAIFTTTITRPKLPITLGASIPAYPILFILAINTIILFIITTLILSDAKKNAQQEIERLHVNNLKAQQHILMQKLQPHFLFNALSILKSLMRENIDEAEDYSIRLSNFLRYSVDSNADAIVDIKEEVQFAENYVALQSVRFDKSVQICFNLNNSCLNKKIPTYAIQTLIENAIKHNKFDDNNPLKVNIYNNEDVVIVTNNKQTTTTPNNTGTGLKNLNERYWLAAKQQIVIEDNQNTFTVYLKLISN